MVPQYYTAEKKLIYTKNSNASKQHHRLSNGAQHLYKITVFK